MLVNQGGDMENTIAQPTLENKVQLVLVATDRCDRCNARALAIAIKNDLGLLFCGHHLREHEPQLAIQGFSIAAQKLDESF